MTNKRYIGSIYENKALNFLEKEGFKLLKQNYYTPYGEIDIIVQKDNKIIAVEVKYRKDPMISIFESISYKKIKRIEKSLMWFMQKENYLDTYILTINAILIEDKNNEITLFLVEDIQASYL